MKASKKDILEVVGIFSVVASLIFVGMQLYFDRKVALADQYFNRAESAKADRRSMLESEDHMRMLEEAWAIGYPPVFWDENLQIAEYVRDGTLSTRSVHAVIARHTLSIIGYDSVYFQYQQGLLPEESWLGLRARMKLNMASDEFLRRVYERYARAAIRPEIEEILREIEAEEESQQATD